MEPVLHSFAYAVGFLREQVADVAAAEMVAQPKGFIHHPAWVIGHLTVTCQQLGGAIGLAPWLSEASIRRFGTGSVPIADTSAYEPKDQALATLTDAQQRLDAAIRVMEPVRLEAPSPDPALRDVFPTIRHALTQVLVGHAAYHIGQVAVWRRAMGLPAMRRSFE